MTDKPKVCVRVARLKGHSAVARAENHGKRIGLSVAHCDPDAPEPNKAYSDYVDNPLDLEEAIHRAIMAQRATVRKGASVAQHLIFTFSPEFFAPTVPGERFDKKKVEAVWAYTIAYLKREFGEGFVAARMDLDETTPHIDAFIVPVSRRVTRRGRVKREVSVRDKFGRPYLLADLQTSYALHMAPLGFVRGTPKTVTQAVNRPYREIHQEVQERSARLSELWAEQGERAEAAAIQEAEDDRIYRAAQAAQKLEREAFIALLDLFRRDKIELLGTGTFLRIEIDNDALPPAELARLKKAVAASPELARTAVDICLRAQGLQAKFAHLREVDVAFCDPPGQAGGDEGHESGTTGNKPVFDFKYWWRKAA
jgi:hypothetical protein